MFLSLGLTAQFASPGHAADLASGPLVLISSPNPLAGCDDGFRPPGSTNHSIHEAGEPFVVVNPTNLKNLVAPWIGGYAQSIIAAISFDGGKRWQRVAIPSLTICSDGAFLGATDPWLSFAPNGDLYIITLPFLPGSAIAVNKSTDGGRSWSSPVFLAKNENVSVNEIVIF